MPTVSLLHSIKFQQRVAIFIFTSHKHSAAFEASWQLVGLWSSVNSCLTSSFLTGRGCLAALGFTLAAWHQLADGRATIVEELHHFRLVYHVLPDRYFCFRPALGNDLRFARA